MAMSEMKQKLLLYELAKIGFREAAYMPETDQMKIQPDNDRMPVINDAGEITYKSEQRDFVYNILSPLVDGVNEVAAAWERANPVPFENLSQFRVLADYGKAMLAARDDTELGRGLYFATWQYDYNRTGLEHGHYMEDYKTAKEDFSIRAGLISSDKIVTREQAAEIVTVIKNLIENDYDLYLTYDKEFMLNEIIGNLRSAYPEIKSQNEIKQEVELTEPEYEHERDYKNNEIPKTNIINGEIACFDVVISTEYPYLVGEVNAVNKVGSPEHDGKSDTDYVFVDFQSEEYSESRIKEIKEHFSNLFGKPTNFKDLVQDADLYNMKVSPKDLIRVNESDLESLLESRENCEAFCNVFPGGRKPQNEKHAELIERVNKNLADYHNHLDGFGNRELIDMAEKISAMSESHDYLVMWNRFTDGELDFLLQFQNPCEVVADALCVRKTDNEDITYAVHYDVLDKDKQNLLNAYPLMSDMKPPEKAEPLAAEKPKQKQKTLAEKMQAAQEKVKAQDKQGNKNKSKKREERD